MAMRRARFRRRRFGGKPLAKQSLSWVSTLFVETALTVNASATSTQILLDSPDWRGDIASLRQVAHIRRIIYDGVMMWVPQSTAQQGDMVSLVWAMWVQDSSEDPPAVLSTGTGSAFQEKRILATGIIGFTALETAGFIVNAIPGERIHVDQRANVVVPPGSRLGMTFNFQSDATGAVTLAAVSAVSRILIVTP